MQTMPLRASAWTLVGTCVLVLLLTPWAAAQVGSSVIIDEVNSSSYPAMTARVSVQDANGVPIPNLDIRTFELVEDGRTSFPPTAVDQEVNPDANVAIALVIDLSGSMAGKPLEEAKTASTRLLDQLIDVENDPDRIAFFGINRAVQPDDKTIDSSVEVPFTNDKNQVLNVVNFLAIEGNRPTPLYDALVRAVHFTAEQGGRRAIILISDGFDTVSAMAAEDPMAEANRAGIPIFPISLSTNRVDEDYLQRLAVRTGGEYRKAPAPEEFSDLFQQVLDQMKLQYKLSYDSRVPQDDQQHSLLLRVRSPRVQAYNEVKFTVPGGLQPAATPAAESSAPAPTAIPTAEAAAPGFFDNVTSFIQDNPLPAALIGIALVLLVALLVLLFVWLRRRRAMSKTAYDYGTAGSEWSISASGGAPPAPSGGITAAPPAADSGVAPSPTATVGSYGIPPGPAPAPYAVPPAAAAAGGTRVIQRLPSHVAMLVDAKNASRRYDLLETTDVGRAQTNTVALSDATISRQHARIRLEEDHFVLYDLGSANGTFLNGTRVEQPVAIKDGDTVRFGEVEFTFKQLS
jgi:VWFA-related protein